MGFIGKIPLFAFVLVIYNVVALPAFNNGSYGLETQIFNIGLISGAQLSLKLKDLILLLAVVSLYIEIFKAAKSTSEAVVDHALSTLVFVIFLIEFLVVQPAGNSLFLVIMMMALFDVIAGFTVSLSTARRDFAIDK